MARATKDYRDTITRMDMANEDPSRPQNFGARLVRRTTAMSSQINDMYYSDWKFYTLASAGAGISTGIVTARGVHTLMHTKMALGATAKVAAGVAIGGTLTVAFLGTAAMMEMLRTKESEAKAIGKERAHEAKLQRLMRG